MAPSSGTIPSSCGRVPRVLIGSTADAGLGAALLVMAVIGGHVWRLALVPGSFLFLGGSARLGLAVVASARDLHIKNRWRSHRVPLTEMEVDTLRRWIKMHSDEEDE